MTEAQTYSWIFYAASAAANSNGVTLRDIETVADGINHAIPTQKEMKISLSWAESKGLIERTGKKVFLTEVGRAFAARFSGKPGSIMKTWDRISAAFAEMGADDSTRLDCRTMKPEQSVDGIRY